MADFIQAATTFFEQNDKVLAGLGSLAAIITLYFFLKDRFAQHRGPRAPKPISLEERKAFAARLREYFVAPWLRHGVLKPIKIRYIPDPDSVAPETEQFHTLVTTVGENDNLKDLFDEESGIRLLIRGEPGAGKTHELYRLADSLLEDVLQAPEGSHPRVPVIFTLADWVLDKDSATAEELVAALHRMMANQLSLPYGRPRDEATQWIAEGAVLPLFDGLDEVRASARPLCARALAAYCSAERSVEFAVACRIEEYEGLERIPAVVSLRSSKIRSDQLEKVLEGLPGCRQALDLDPELEPLMVTPLNLTLLRHGLGVESNEPEPQDRLYERFLKAKLTSGPLAAVPEARQWLGWLAASLQTRDNTWFSLEDLDETWFRSWRAAMEPFELMIGLIVQTTFWLIRGLIVGSIVVLFSGLGAVQLFGLNVVLSFGLNDVTFWLIIGLFSGLVFGSIVGLDGDEPVESLGWNWSGITVGLIVGLIVGLLVGLLGGLSSGLLFALSFGSFGGLIAGLFVGLSSGLRPVAVSERSVANAATRRSRRYALRILATGLAIAAGASGISHLLSDRVVVEVRVVFALFAPALSCGVAWVAFDKGGAFVVRHYIVRLLLWHRRIAPLRYVRFLEQCADARLLKRVGGSYQFFHREFRDYVARRYGAQWLPTDQPDPADGGVNS